MNDRERWSKKNKGTVQSAVIESEMRPEMDKRCVSEISGEMNKPSKKNYRCHAICSIIEQEYYDGGILICIRSIAIHWKEDTH